MHSGTTDRVAVTVHDYPDGSMGGSLVVTPAVSPHRATSKPLTDEERALREAANRMRSARRSRAALASAVRHNDLRRLLTFTNGGPHGGWANRGDCLSCIHDWWRYGGGRALLGDTGMAVVAERGGKGNRWHAHAVIRAGYRLDYSAIIASWSAFLTARGYISPTGVHRWHAGDEHGKHRNGFTSARWAARYLTKYLTKSIGQEDRADYEHVYRRCDLSTPEPWRFRAPSLSAALSALGLSPGDCYALTYDSLDPDTGELLPTVYGYLFDCDPDGG